jgi:FkbM family methyltransferase
VYRENVKLVFRKIIHKIISKLRNYPPINKKGNGIIGFIDVGSKGALPSPWREHADIINVLLRFEPQENSASEDFVISFDHALWEKNMVRDFYIYRGFEGTGSSLFKQNIDYVRSNFDELKKYGSSTLARTWFDRSECIEVRNIACRTLDGILEDLNIAFDFLKIDAQGAEYQILKGAERFLKDKCLGLHLELFNIPLYKDIKLLPEVRDYLAGIGFSLKKQMPAHGTFNSQHDCIFLKEKVDENEQHKLEKIKMIYKIPAER